MLCACVCVCIYYQVYDPAKNEWTLITPPPLARSSHRAVVMGDQIYVLGGQITSSDGRTVVATDKVETYKPCVRRVEKTR